MKWLKPYLLFENFEQIDEFLDYLKLDLEDEGFSIRRSNIHEFLQFKWKNTRFTSKESLLKDKDYKNINRNCKVYEILTESHHKKGSNFAWTFNLYDVEPHVKRLLDYAKSIGYTKFEIRKITQMSRQSQDVTSAFTGKGHLREPAKREIYILQILIEQ